VVTVLAAAGKEVILVETVGVGQDEVEIVGTAEVSLVVLVPGLGDEVQALKAGIMEIADVFVVNKADREGVDRVVAEIQSMLGTAGHEGEGPEIVKTVATKDVGTAELVEAIERYRARAGGSGALEQKRRLKARHELEDAVRTRVMRHVFEAVLPAAEAERAVDRLVRREVDPFTEAEAVARRMGF
jgi:LAO/AO transport system kinase